MLHKCLCGKTLQIPDTLAGKRIRCPHCQTAQTVPGSEAEELPIALDHPPPPKPKAKPPAPAAAPAVPAAESAASAPPAAVAPERVSAAQPSAESALGDLAAAVNQAVAGKPAAAGSGPVRPKPVSAPPAGGATPKAPVAKARSGAVVTAMAVDGPPKKKRDPLPLIVVGSAGGLFLIVLLVVLIRGLGPKEPEPTATVPTRLPPVESPREVTGGNPNELFYGVGSNSYAESERKKQAKAEAAKKKE